MSTESTDATGFARIDQVNGFARVEVEGLDAARSWDVWLVENVEGPGRSALPEAGDHMHKLGRLSTDGKRAVLNADVDSRLFNDFRIDVVAVTRAGSRPEQGAVLYGSPMLFQRLYAKEKAKPRQAPLLRTSMLGFGAQPVFADTIFNSMDPMIAKGAQIFFNEKFGGNGRVCATCHPAENNFTIDPKFIANLPANSPLFVGETTKPTWENVSRSTSCCVRSASSSRTRTASRISTTSTSCGPCRISSASPAISSRATSRRRRTSAPAGAATARRAAARCASSLPAPSCNT